MSTAPARAAATVALTFDIVGDLPVKSVTSTDIATAYGGIAALADAVNAGSRTLCGVYLSPYSPPRIFNWRSPMVESKTKKDVKKVVLAYSGGLDTSIILKWLQQTYGCEVVTFTADLGQGEELEPARKKALMLGIKPDNIFIEDLREEFVRDYVFPMFRANALYEGQYLLGTSIARPLIAKKQIEIAEKVDADAVAHGATGKGNDQVRFELTYYALKPDVTVIAPWREWDLTSRSKLIEFAEKHQIPIAKDKRRSRSTPICCTPPRKAKCWKTRRRTCPTTSIRARSIRKRRPTTRPSSSSISSAAIRWRSTGRKCRRRRCSRRSTISAGRTASAGSIWWRTASSA
jgi:hypothetical protein